MKEKIFGEYRKISVQFQFFSIIIYRALKKLLEARDLPPFRGEVNYSNGEAQTVMCFTTINAQKRA